MKKGDVIKCPPKVKHWHGATEKISLTQMYILPKTQNGIVTWLEAVTDEQEGMLIAMIEHPPAFGKKLKSFDATETLKMPGIKEVFSAKLYEDGYEQAGFDTRTFNDLLVL